MDVLCALDRRNWGYDSRVGGFDTRACFNKCCVIFDLTMENDHTQNHGTFI